MQENSRPMAARVGALSATALLAVSGTFIAGPAMAGTVEPDLPPATEAPTDAPTTPATDEPTAPATGAPTAPATGAPTAPATDAPTAPATGAPTTEPSTPAPTASPTAGPAANPVLEIATESSVLVGQSLKGTAPGATSLLISWEGSAEVSVPVAADGSFTLTAPTESGHYVLRIRSTNGSGYSGYSSYELEVLEENQLPSPRFVLDSIVETSLSTITGTGVAGATVELSVAPYPNTGDRVDPITVPVAADGTWSVTLSAPLSYGQYNVAAIQTQENKLDSPLASTYVSVAPVAPVFTSMGDSTVVPVDQLPEYITGTAIPGALVRVVIDIDAQYEAAANDPGREIVYFEGEADENGNWAVSTEGLTVGSHEILADQTINDVASAWAESDVIVTAAAVADPADPANTGTGTITVTGNTGAGSNLAETGAQNVGVLAAGGAGLLAAGAAALFLTKRRRTVSDS